MAGALVWRRAVTKSGLMLPREASSPLSSAMSEMRKMPLDELEEAAGHPPAKLRLAKCSELESRWLGTKDPRGLDDEARRASGPRDQSRPVETRGGSAVSNGEGQPPTASRFGMCCM
jgi:hypothetical protein